MLDDIREQINNLKTEANADRVSKLLNSLAKFEADQIAARAEYWHVAEALQAVQKQHDKDASLIDGLYTEIGALREMFNPDGSTKANLKQSTRDLISGTPWRGFYERERSR